MNLLENFRILDIIDIILVACLLYYLYKLVKGTVAINIFFGICIIWVIWKITQLLQMEMLSSILGQFIGAGMFALIVVFQQEIRKFLLLIGSTKLDRRSGFLKHIKFLQDDQITTTKVEEIIRACESMALTKTGALIVIQRNTNLDFVKNTGDKMQIEVNKPILESIFIKTLPCMMVRLLLKTTKSPLRARSYRFQMSATSPYVLACVTALLWELLKNRCRSPCGKRRNRTDQLFKGRGFCDV